MNAETSKKKLVGFLVASILIGTLFLSVSTSAQPIEIPEDHGVEIGGIQVTPHGGGEILIYIVEDGICISVVRLSWYGLSVIPQQ